VTRSQAFKARNRPLLVVLAVIAGLVVLGVVAACVTGIHCGFDSTYLPGLKADPMATFEPASTELVFSHNDSDGTSLGMPRHASVTRSLLILDQQNSQAVLEEFVSQAESVGWVLSLSPSEVYAGSKQLEAGLGQIHIGLAVEDPLRDPDGPLVVVVILDYDRRMSE